MKTESASFNPLPASEVVPRSLQELVPQGCQVLDLRGRPVPLSSAGFVLADGHKYRIRCRPPADKDFQDAQILSPPEFLEVGQPIFGADEHSKTFLDFPVRVRKDKAAFITRLGNVRYETLEINFRFRVESGKHTPSYHCPIVVRPGWAFALLGLFGSLLFLVIHLLLQRWAQERNSGQDISWYLELLQSPIVWAIVFISVAAFVGAIFLWTGFWLYRRRRELRDEFRKAYPSAGAASDDED